MGLSRGAMLHDAPLDFIWLGLLLERTGQTARILDVHHHALTIARARAHPVVEVAVWLSLLRACYGFEPFMKSHRGAVTGKAVASFLIFEARFPRAIRHCVRRAREGLAHIRPPGEGPPPLPALARLEALEARLDAKAATPLDEAGVHALLPAWARRESWIFLVHVRTAIGGAITEANPQPFQRAWGRRDWLIAHSGSLERKLEPPARFEPIGSTDSEQILCDLLARIAGRGFRSIGEIPPRLLASWFRHLHSYGGV